MTDFVQGGQDSGALQETPACKKPAGPGTFIFTLRIHILDDGRWRCTVCAMNSGPILSDSPITRRVVAIREAGTWIVRGLCGDWRLMRKRSVVNVGGLLVLGGLFAGCALDARVDLAAAGAMDRLAGSVEGVVNEYHAEIDKADDAMEVAVVDAYVDRIRRDVADDGAVEAHNEKFRLAMKRVRDDRAVEFDRYRAALDNVDVMREVARGLRRLAAESMSLEDDARRYLFSLLESAQASSATPAS